MQGLDELVWWGSAVVGGTMEDHLHGGCSSVQVPELVEGYRWMDG